MKKPVLVIMAAGMGSRYGGLKQIDPVDEYGNIIMDFSIYAAREAGFEKVIFIIKRENRNDFEEAIGARLRKYMEVEYVFQELSNVPEGYVIPEGRVKPLGTGHAVLSAAASVDGPFTVINADDYYGKTAFKKMYDFLTASSGKTEGKDTYAMVGFQVENTLTENGTVSRGVCVTDDDSRLVSITERLKIKKTAEAAAYTEDDGATWTDIPAGTTVSMNFWGFTENLMKELEARFPAFLDKGLKENPMKCEYLLPAVVSDLIHEGKAEVKVLTSPDQWFGITYKEDKPAVMESIRREKAKGVYPEKLWE